MSHLMERVRQARPLVHCITNYVTMEWVARGLLAAGARPIMARDAAESADVAAAAGALVLNLGTWSPDVHGAMLAAGKAANAQGIPVVLDPVGAGALKTRTRAALELLAEVKIAAVRGNAGEIAALAGVSGLVSGVDARGVGTRVAVVVARRATRQFGCVIAATGPVDVVSDGARTLEVKAGHPLMAQIPGAGCLATALIAAALGASPDQNQLTTVAEALLWAGTAGEAAAEATRGPGSFAAAYLDTLAAADSLPEGRIAPPLADRLSLCVIVSGTTPLETVQAILANGAGAIQFREKRQPLSEQMAAASAIRDLCHRHGALFLVNDRVDLALALAADGVHLGQDDLPIAAARALLGPQAIIGGTCETEAEARRAEAEGADYIGTGPVYATPSKADAGEPYGPAIVKRVSAATSLPVVGIGGIGIGGAAPVIDAGGCGVAVISAVVGASDPGAATRCILTEVHQAKERAEV